MVPREERGAGHGGAGAAWRPAVAAHGAAGPACAPRVAHGGLRVLWCFNGKQREKKGEQQGEKKGVRRRTELEGERCRKEQANQ